MKKMLFDRCELEYDVEKSSDLIYNFNLAFQEEVTIKKGYPLK